MLFFYLYDGKYLYFQATNEWEIEDEVNGVDICSECEPELTDYGKIYLNGTNEEESFVFLRPSMKNSKYAIKMITQYLGE